VCLAPMYFLAVAWVRAWRGRAGALWDAARAMREAGLHVDDRSYYCCFRVDTDKVRFASAKVRIGQAMPNAAEMFGPTRLAGCVWQSRRCCCGASC
jgi:hypothetical protein